MASTKLTPEMIKRIKHLRFVERKPAVAIAWELGVAIADIRKHTVDRNRNRPADSVPDVSPLTDDQAHEVRLAYARMGIAPLAMKYGVGQRVIRHIITGILNPKAGGPLHQNPMSMIRRRPRARQKKTPTAIASQSLKAAPHRRSRTVEDHDAYARPLE